MNLVDLQTALGITDLHDMWVFTLLKGFSLKLFQIFKKKYKSTINTAKTTWSATNAV